MNLHSFVVRPRRRLAEEYAEPEAWANLTKTEFTELTQKVGGLPAELEPEPEEANHFDLLTLNLQLALLRPEPAFERLVEQVKAIYGILDENGNIPMGREQMPLIQGVQTDEWWQEVAVPLLELLRRRLRSLVRLIEEKHREPIYTDCEDELGDETGVAPAGFTPARDFEKFRAKARGFLRAHQDQITIYKLRMDKILTTTDCAGLERILVQSGIDDSKDIARAKEEFRGLGLFVRSPAPLGREAAKETLALFLAGKTLAAKQLELLNLMVNHLTEHEVMNAGLLHESPFTDLYPQGPDGHFASPQVDELISLPEDVYAHAVA